MVCLVQRPVRVFFIVKIEKERRYMKQNIEQIRLGLPKGSLNTPGRGDTKQVLIDAGYEVRGYESGKESPRRLSIVNDPEIRPFLRRPAGLPIELDRGLLDIGITGEDWVEEERVNGGRRYGVRRIGNLEYGQTRLVIAVAENSGYKSLSDVFDSLTGRGLEEPVLCSTEYVNLTERAFMQNEVYRKLFGDRSPLVRYRGLMRGRNRRVQILGSDGTTEASIGMGFDIIVDNSQSSDSLRDNHLREIGQIMISSAGLYAGPTCIGWKGKKAQEIFEQLRGAVEGKKYLDVKFNTPIAMVDELTEYLIREGLYADEPTIVLGRKIAQVDILIPRGRFPSTLATLRGNYSASSLIANPVTQFIK